MTAGDEGKDGNWQDACILDPGYRAYAEESGWSQSRVYLGHQVLSLLLAFYFFVFRSDKFASLRCPDVWISPTRELAAQIAAEANALTKFHGLAVQVLVGADGAVAELSTRAPVNLLARWPVVHGSPC